MIINKGRHCPVCNFNNKHILSELCSNLEILARHFPKVSSDNVACTRCGAVYVDTKATQADFDLYYRDVAKVLNYAEAFGQDTSTEYFETVYAAIAPYININSHILDIGCGSGEFAQLLLTKGHKNVVAVDISPTSVNAAKNSSVQAFVYNITQPNEVQHNNAKNHWLGRFDVIVYSHTLEHVLNVNESIKNVKHLLKKDGILFVEVPDAEKYCAVDLVPYFFFTYEHLMHFTCDTLKNIARVNGLNLIQHRTYLKCRRYYVIYGLYRHLNDAPVTAIVPETKSISAVTSYENMCRANLHNSIQALERSGEELILWGVGSSTAQLLNRHFDGCKVVKLVDSNISRQGIEFKINEKPLRIESPDTITDSSATIVVLPIMFKDSIMHQIQDSGLKNKIKTLETYNLPSA